MDEEKAAAYYEELSRKGEGASRFKQGLGYSSNSSSTSFTKSSHSLSSFVAASGSVPENQIEDEKKIQIQSIQNKLKKTGKERDGERHQNRRRDDRNEDDRRHQEDVKVSRDRERRRRSRSRSVSPERGSRRRLYGNERERRNSDSHRRRRRRRSGSPRRDRKDERRRKEELKRDIPDYSKLIEGYDEMTPAERVKAKMKIQLSQTASRDSSKGMSTEWERFDFNKEAPLDDEVLEADDNAKESGLLKNVGKTFRFAAVEANREAASVAAHDQAMFGVPTASSVLCEKENGGSNAGDPDSHEEEESKISIHSVVSEQVIATQQGSWRDRARKLQNR